MAGDGQDGHDINIIRPHFKLINSVFDIYIYDIRVDINIDTLYYGSDMKDRL